MKHVNLRQQVEGVAPCSPSSVYAPVTELHALVAERLQKEYAVWRQLWFQTACLIDMAGAAQ
jgi:hypothetical protein